MNADLSVAPEIAQLAAPALLHDPASLVPPTDLPPTDGRRAADLAELAAAPQRWWDLVRFDPAGPVRIPVPALPGSWLLVLPPGAATDCRCRLATALAGEAAEEETVAGPGNPAPVRTLRPGRVRLHAGTTSTISTTADPGTTAGDTAPAPANASHTVRAAGPGYSVTLHAS